MTFSGSLLLAVCLQPLPPKADQNGEVQTSFQTGEKEAGSDVIVQGNIQISSQCLPVISHLCCGCVSVPLNHSNLLPQPFNLSLLCPGSFTHVVLSAVSLATVHNS